MKGKELSQAVHTLDGEKKLAGGAPAQLVGAADAIWNAAAGAKDVYTLALMANHAAVHMSSS